MITIRKEPKSKNYWIVTVAIGKEYLSEWEHFAAPSWLHYCDRHGIGLAVVEDDLISKQNSFYKKPHWQKLLVGKAMFEAGFHPDSICHLDADILISPMAPNVFDFHDPRRISVVSSVHSLPYGARDQILRRVAFYRNRYFSSDYPLDSLLFASVEDLFKYQGFHPKNNYFCSGLFLYDPNEYSEFLTSIFFKYGMNIQTLTDGGEQPVLNFEFQEHAPLNWIDYRFQALWLYEMAWKYPFLYWLSDSGVIPAELSEICVEASLSTNYFLHFAGTWHEGTMWKRSFPFLSGNHLRRMEDLHSYLQFPVTGKPVGRVVPK